MFFFSFIYFRLKVFIKQRPYLKILVNQRCTLFTLITQKNIFEK